MEPVHRPPKIRRKSAGIYRRTFSWGAACGRRQTIPVRGQRRGARFGWSFRGRPSPFSKTLRWVRGHPDQRTGGDAGDIGALDGTAADDKDLIVVLTRLNRGEGLPQPVLQTSSRSGPVIAGVAPPAVFYRPPHFLCSRIRLAISSSSGETESASSTR